MTTSILISTDELERLQGIEESYKALQKAYERLTDRIAHPPVIEPSEAEKNKRELEQVKESVQLLRASNDQLRSVLTFIVENAI